MARRLAPRRGRGLRPARGAGYDRALSPSFPPRLLALALASVAMSSCAKRPPTAVVLAFSSQARVPGELDQLEVTATRRGSDRFDRIYSFPADGTLPATLTLANGADEDPSDALTIRVRGRRQGGPWRVTREARLGFVKERTKVLRLALEYACFDKPCEPGSTCIGGLCRDEGVDPSGLPDFTDNTAITDPPGCFNSARCLSLPAHVPLPLDACAFPAPGPAGSFNVALFWAVAPASPVVLDVGAGYTLANGKVTLTEVPCGALKSGTAVGVGTTSACPTKAVDAVVCPEGGGGGSGGGSGGSSGSSGGSGGSSGGSGGGNGGGSSGAGGSGGSGGAAGNAGQSGSGGAAGKAGQSGSGGAAGKSGQSGSGGAAGKAGQGGSGGAAGKSGGGSGGASGAGGAAGGGGCVSTCDAGNVLHVCNAFGTTTDLDCGAGLCDANVPACKSTGKATAIANGLARSCAVSAGETYCWGYQPTTLGLGPSAPTVVVTPQKLPGMNGAIVLSGGNDHMCAAKGDGSLWCWGDNQSEQLGITGSSDVAVQQTSVAGAVEVVAGHYATCARTSAGQVSCWGSNAYGQLGNNSLTNSLAPVAVGTFPNTVQLVLDDIGCVLSGAGQAMCWGTSSATPAVPKDIGVTSAVELGVGGSGRTWIFARLADGTLRGVLPKADGTGYLAPITISLPVTMAKVAHIAVGHQLCALLSDGSVQCADFDDGNVYPFVPVPTLGAASTIAISVGYSGTAVDDPLACALSGAGVVRCWGANHEGELGNGKPDNLKAPVQMLLPPAAKSVGVASISAGGRSTTLTLKDGSIWGTGHSAALGLQTASTYPTAVSGLPASYSSARVGSYDDSLGYAIKKGAGAGVDSFVNGALMPQGLATATKNDFSEAFPGINFDAALAQNGDVLFYAFQANPQQNGEFGGDPALSVAAGSFPTLTGKGPSGQLLAFLSHGGGERTHLCLRAAGELWCWGASLNGEVGTNAYVAAVYPPFKVPVPGLGVTAACVGAYHTCAVNSAGFVYCWGSGNYGENGQSQDVNVPAPVTLPGTVGDIACGRQFTCAWALGGAPYCWGQNNRGQLGDGTLVDHASPSQPVFPMGVQTMALGDTHACAKLLDGSIWCMGSSYFGQSGAGVDGARPTPDLALLPLRRDHKNETPMLA